MARTTLTVCLCSIILLFQTASPSEGSIVAIGHDLPISIEDALRTPVFESGLSRDLFLENFRSPACLIFDRLAITTKSTSPGSELSTCPAETRIAKNTWNSEAAWATTNAYVSSKRTALLMSIRSAQMACNELLVDVSLASSKTIGRISWSNLIGSAESLKTMIPAVFVSHENSEISEPSESQLNDLWPIVLPESSQDPYWQYYEDCDRWDVDFANLLMDAETDLDESATQTAVIDKNSLLSADSDSQFSIFRLIASQNLSTWLYPSPRFQAETSGVVFRWLELVEFNMVETSEFDFVLVRQETVNRTTAPQSPQAIVLRSALAFQIDQVSRSLNFWVDLFRSGRDQVVAARTSMVETINSTSNN